MLEATEQARQLAAGHRVAAEVLNTLAVGLADAGQLISDQVRVLFADQQAGEPADVGLAVLTVAAEWFGGKSGDCLDEVPHAGAEG